MIRNQYIYLTSSIQDTKGKEGRTLSNDTTMKTLSAESQKDSFFPKIDQTAINKKKKKKKKKKKSNLPGKIVNHSKSTALEWSVKILLGA